MDFLIPFKRDISKKLKYLLEQKIHSLPASLKKEKHLLENLSLFAQQGKLLRGSLILFAHDMFRGKQYEAALETAVAFELFHSSFLIHDDIIDNDYLRRGNKSIFALYKELGEKRLVINAEHFGKSIGICLGDIGIFLAYEILSSITVPQEIKVKLFGLLSSELGNVGLAQSQDVAWGFSNKSISRDAIMSIYTYKTARYTFSLPLVAGALLANKDEKTLNTLDKLGEYLGIIFQIKDDELGIFGNSKQTGKPVGNDIKEGKKTLYYYYLFSKSIGEEKKRLNLIFGNKNLKDKDFEFIKSELRRLKIVEDIKEILKKLSQKVAKLINSLSVSKENKDKLRAILEFNLKRKK